MVLNGFIATVGCQRVVYNTKEALMKDFEEYIDDPIAKERNMQENSLNSKVFAAGGDAGRNERAPEERSRTISTGSTPQSHSLGVVQGSPLD